MASHTSDDVEVEGLRFNELSPKSNAAARAMLYMCKIRSDDTNRLEDYWNAILASYFQLEEGFMICRSTVRGFRTLTIAVAPKDDISQLRVLLHVSFSLNDAVEPPFDTICKDNFQQGHAVDAVVCMTMGTTTYKPFLVVPPGSPGEDCRHLPLKINREDGGSISFGNRFYRMDAEPDRKGLDEILKILRTEGLGLNRADMREEVPSTLRQQQSQPAGGQSEASEERELGSGDAPREAVDSTTGVKTEPIPEF